MVAHCGVKAGANLSYRNEGQEMVLLSSLQLVWLPCIQLAAIRIELVTKGNCELSWGRYPRGPRK